MIAIFATPVRGAPTMPPAGGDRLRVGVTLGLQRPDESLWSNGIKQNAIFLCMALQAAPNVQSACLVNVTAMPIHGELPWDPEWQPLLAFEQVCDRLDVMIELGGQLSPRQTEVLKRRGTRIVSYCCGSEYVSAMEAVLFERPLWGRELFINQRYDALWVIPQVAELNRGFFEVLRSRRSDIVPFIWDPVFLEQRCAGLERGGQYHPREGAARIAVMEPNIDVLKFCLYPLLIAEQAYRCRPDLIGVVHVTNTERFAGGNDDFIALMNQLALVREHKADFLARYETPVFLAEAADAVVSHQWGNPLNYLYLEVCWQGYPLVHNAEMCTDLGYYYPGHDLQQGARVLCEALASHDSDWQAYRARQRQRIQRFRPTHPAVVSSYAQLLEQLMHCPLR